MPFVRLWLARLSSRSSTARAAGRCVSLRVDAAFAMVITLECEAFALRSVRCETVVAGTEDPRLLVIGY